MKRIYLADSHGDYKSFVFEEDTTRMDPLDLDGTKIGKKKWAPTAPTLYEKSHHHEGDFWNFHTYPLILSERANQVLGQRLKACAEILPLKYRKKDYYVVNCTTFVDCLDKKRTGWAEDDYVQENPFFDPNRISDALIFRIPQDYLSHYLSQGFVDLCREGDLEGIHFNEVWNESM